VTNCWYKYFKQHCTVSRYNLRQLL